MKLYLKLKCVDDSFTKSIAIYQQQTLTKLVRITQKIQECRNNGIITAYKIRVCVTKNMWPRTETKIYG